MHSNSMCLCPIDQMERRGRERRARVHSPSPVQQWAVAFLEKHKGIWA